MLIGMRACVSEARIPDRKPHEPFYLSYVSSGLSGRRRERRADNNVTAAGIHRSAPRLEPAIAIVLGYFERLVGIKSDGCTRAVAREQVHGGTAL